MINQLIDRSIERNKTTVGLEPMVTLVIATHLFYIQYNNQNHNINIKNNEDLCSPARRTTEEPKNDNATKFTSPRFGSYFYFGFYPASTHPPRTSSATKQRNTSIIGLEPMVTLVIATHLFYIQYNNQP